MKERVPDFVFDKATQVELVDIEPDVLIERLNAKKIYRETQAKHALHHFFTRDNLVALREIALRRIADKVNREVESNRTEVPGRVLLYGRAYVLLSAFCFTPFILSRSISSPFIFWAYSLFPIRRTAGSTV